MDSPRHDGITQPQDRNPHATTPPSAQAINDDEPVVLLVTGRLPIVEQVMTISARLRVTLLAAPRLTPSMRRHVTQAPVMLVGADVLPAMAGQGLQQHPGLVVVADTPDPAVLETTELLLGSALVIWLPQASDWLADYIAAHASVPNPHPREPGED